MVAHDDTTEGSQSSDDSSSKLVVDAAAATRSDDDKMEEQETTQTQQTENVYGPLLEERNRWKDRSSDRTRTDTGGGADDTFFPSRLFLMLNDADSHGFHSIVSWGHDGKAVVVHDKARFEQHILPKYFKMSKYKSYTRQLHNYNFQWIKKGRDKHGYFNPDFSRHDPDKSRQLVRKNQATSPPSANKTAGAVYYPHGAHQHPIHAAWGGSFQGNNHSPLPLPQPPPTYGRSSSSMSQQEGLRVDAPLSAEFLSSMLGGNNTSSLLPTEQRTTSMTTSATTTTINRGIGDQQNGSQVQWRRQEELSRQLAASSGTRKSLKGQESFRSSSSSSPTSSGSELGKGTMIRSYYDAPRHTENASQLNEFLLTTRESIGVIVHGRDAGEGQSPFSSRVNHDHYDHHVVQKMMGPTTGQHEDKKESSSPDHGTKGAKKRQRPASHDHGEAVVPFAGEALGGPAGSMMLPSLRPSVPQGSQQGDHVVHPTFCSTTTGSTHLLLFEPRTIEEMLQIGSKNGASTGVAEGAPRGGHEENKKA